ncbi:MAG: response regulator transcription factor [Cereibacter changlensis]
MEHSSDAVAASKPDFEPQISSTVSVPTLSTDRHRTLVAIDPRTLERQCFLRCVELAHPDLPVTGCGSIAEWQARADLAGAAQVVLYNTGNREVAEPAVQAELTALVAAAGPSPVLVLGVSNDLREMITAFDCGAKGYLPASGGIFLPMASLGALREALANKPEPRSSVEDHLTERQLAVCNALRRGKSNKIIAYELNLCESTVKVHIRNIMKKLRATNRTEAAFKLNATYFDSEDARAN